MSAIVADHPHEKRRHFECLDRYGHLMPGRLSPVVEPGVDPGTFRFSGGRSAD
jgi:hypothetical protein